MDERIVAQLRQFLKGEVSDDVTTRTAFSRDASLFQIAPELVVAPTDTEDIKNLVKFASHHPALKLSLTARSAGTDMTGGPLNTSIIVDMKTHFNKIKKVGSDYAVTEPGVYYRDFEKATQKHGLLMPSYPASRELCTVGGMVANNSGGEKTLAYGKTENYIKELKMVLRDGEEYTFKPLSVPELEHKMRLKTLEGEIYRKLSSLIHHHLELICRAKPKVSKNSAGYLLWNVWDGKQFDLTKLIVGSQGTLGIITEISFKLIKPHKKSHMLVIFLKDLKPLAEIVNKVLEHKPESFESYDDHTLSLAVRFFPEIAKKIGSKNIVSLGLQFLPEASIVMTSGLPKLILLAEFTGESEAEVMQRAHLAQAALADFKLKTLITRTKKEEKKYWIVRRESFNLLRHHIKDKHTAPFIDDVVVRPEQLPQFLPELDAIMAKYNLIYTIAGHVGDGNFHIIPLMSLADPKSRKIIPELSEKVYELVFRYNGSITGEHNDGLIRTPYLKSMYGPKVYELFEAVKHIFDPQGIFNPGKKVHARLKYAMDHLIKE